MDYLLGGALGGLIAFVFSIPAIVLEPRRHRPGHEGGSPLLIEVKTMFGVRIRHTHEVFLIGLLVHILVGCVFGMVYVLFAQWSWVSGLSEAYGIVSLLLYALLSWVVVNVLVYPVLGFGVFALREGKSVWLETLFAHLLLGVSLWLCVQYFQPVFFSTPF